MYCNQYLKSFIFGSALTAFRCPPVSAWTEVKPTYKNKFYDRLVYLKLFVGYRSNNGPSFLKTYLSIACNMAITHNECAIDCTTLSKNVVNPKSNSEPKPLRKVQKLEKSKEKPVPWKVQPLQPKRRAPVLRAELKMICTVNIDMPPWLPRQCCLSDKLRIFFEPTSSLLADLYPLSCLFPLTEKQLLHVWIALNRTVKQHECLMVLFVLLHEAKAVACAGLIFL